MHCQYEGSEQRWLVDMYAFYSEQKLCKNSREHNYCNWYTQSV